MFPVYVKPAQPQHHSSEEQEPAGDEHRGGDHVLSPCLALHGLTVPLLALPCPSQPRLAPPGPAASRFGNAAFETAVAENARITQTNCHTRQITDLLEC